MCQLIGAKCEKDFYVPIFTKPSGQTYEFEAPSKKSLGKNPLLQDPYEAKRVYVQTSKLEQGTDFFPLILSKSSLITKKPFNLHIQILINFRWKWIICKNPS